MEDKSPLDRPSRQPGGRTPLCPRCGGDWAQSVPRIVQDGRIPPEHRRDGGPAHTPLAGRLTLTPDPPESDTLTLVLAAALPGLCFIAIFGPPLWLVLAAIDGAVLAAIGVTNRRGRRRTEARGALAHPLWSAAWYCHRCDVVWRPKEAPEVMSPARFQHELWSYDTAPRA